MAIDDYLIQTEHDLSSWQGQWQEVLNETAGVAAHLPDGADYVEEIRRADADRLTELDS
jgi:hypothetical protein